MRCPSCNASYSDSDRCTECGAIAPSASESESQLEQSKFESFQALSNTNPSPAEPVKKSTLIEFPGVVRSTMPDWRRELSERVREVQERRAREAAQEAAEAAQATVANPSTQLELLPQSPVPAMNPLVAAALRRIERANQTMPSVASAGAVSHVATAAAIAFVTEEELESSPDETPATSAAPLDLEPATVEAKPTQAEKIHNLVVVPTSMPAPAAVLTNVTVRTEPRLVAKRLISENDPALNYLTAIPTTLRPDEINERKAGIVVRICSAIVDLMVCALLFSPFVAAVELTHGDWYRLRTIAIAVAVAAVIAFVYLTAATALTGRTVGMRLLSLRTVDRRTGLIPTGAQSAGRALVYVGSLLALGFPVLLALLNREGYTVHDQLTHTVVVRV